MVKWFLSIQALSICLFLPSFSLKKFLYNECKERTKKKKKDILHKLYLLRELTTLGKQNLHKTLTWKLHSLLVNGI